MSLVMVGTGVVFLYLTQSEEFHKYLEAGWTESQNAYTLEQLGQADFLFIVPGIIGVILGIAAMILLKKSYPTKQVSWG